MYFLIISGMSGAGKSRAVATLEDLGYYCVDNLPIALIPRFAEVCLAATERYERVALVTDVRAGGDFQQLFDSLDSIRDMGCDYRILFLDTDTATLIRRYKETRRRPGRGHLSLTSFPSDDGQTGHCRLRRRGVVGTRRQGQKGT